jgi:precorrin-8X/cobalt-precorrin-8 methylmutase
MKIKLEQALPGEIEKKSLEIITAELGETHFRPEELPILKRVIHTTADFDYAQNLCFQNDAVAAGLSALLSGATIITDTNMALAGINKPALEKLGCHAVCFMSDPEIAAVAKRTGTTRAVAAMDKAASLSGPMIFAIGNAPTALIHLYELIADGKLSPALVIGVPVGFVNVVESKNLMLSLNVPSIIARGRKGGSNVAAAICNALLYLASGRTLG